MAGRKTMTLQCPDVVSGERLLPVKPLTAARDGFSMNAAVVCEAHQRDKLERVCRYVSRGPIALERLTIDGDGLVVYELKHPFSNGTTHVLFEPLDFIARLAALVPRPRVHLVRYHGLFAPHAKHRHQIVASQTPALPPDNGQGATDETSEPKPTAPMSWMQRLRRVFEIDLRHCPRCGGAVRVIAEITDPGLIARILAHRDAGDGFTDEARVGAARAPPAASLHSIRPPTSDSGVCELSRSAGLVRQQTGEVGLEQVHMSEYWPSACQPRSTGPFSSHYYAPGTPFGRPFQAAEYISR